MHSRNVDDLVHGLHGGDRKFAVNGPDLRTDGGQDSHGIAGGAHGELQPAPRVLAIRDIHVIIGIVHEAVIPNVADDADNFAIDVFVAPRADAFAEGVLVGK
jgi:hypothetical protein